MSLYSENIEKISLKDYDVCKPIPSKYRLFVADKKVIELRDQMRFLLQLINKLCNRYDIPYVLTDGTGVGVARHHGFIPWDDDMDVTIPHSFGDTFYTILKNYVNYEQFNTNTKYKVNVTKFNRYHGWIKMYLKKNDGFDIPKFNKWNWPFIDIYHPGIVFPKTDPKKWVNKLLKDPFDPLGTQYQVFWKDEYQFKRYRWAFFYNNNINISNNMIFKVHYKLREYEQNRLKDVKSGDYMHVYEKWMDEMPYWNNNLIQQVTINKMRKYYSFVTYQFINKTFEREILYKCNTDIILQIVEYKRHYYYDKYSDNWICEEYAKRIRPYDNDILQKISAFYVNSKYDCQFKKGLV